MIFNSYYLLSTILLFTMLWMGCRFVFKKAWLNHLLILIGNVVVLTYVVSPKSLFLLALVALLMYGAGILLHRRKKGWLLALTLTVLIAVFAVRNYPFVQHFLGDWWQSVLRKHFLSLEKIGLSYVLFRMIHWLVESYRGTLRNQHFIPYVNYLLFFPTFLAGPIDTFNNFNYWVENTHVRFQSRMALAGIARIFVGTVKTFLIVPLMLPYATDYQTLLPHFSAVGSIVLAAVLYTFYIYIDFSGYTDIAVGTAYLLGIRTPENFNQPYLSANPSEFWKRWHMTFSNFLKIYVFKPIVRLINRFSVARYRILVSVMGYMVTFTVCGLWHGTTMNFLLWGWWHGVGLSVYKIISSKIQKPVGNLWKWIGVVLTFVFVTIGWMFFNYSMEELHTIFNTLCR